MRFAAIFSAVLISCCLAAQSGGAIRPAVVNNLSDTGYCKGLPLDSVKIVAFIPGTTDTLRAVTDTTGKANLKPIPGGTYVVLASKNGFVSREIKGVIVSEMKTTYLCIEMHPVISPETKKRRKKRLTNDQPFVF